MSRSPTSRRPTSRSPTSRSPTSRSPTSRRPTNQSAGHAAPPYAVPAYDVPTYQPPAYQGYPQQDQPWQGYAPTAPAGYGYPAPQKTNVMAVLGLVFAFLLAPLGVVFSAIGLSQTKRRGEKGRGLALAGLIISIVAVVLEVLVIGLAVAAAERVADTTAAHSVAQSSTPAPAGDSATTGSTDGAGAPGLTGSDPQGVLSACKVALPALLNLATDLQNVSTPDEYAQALAKLETTLEGATALTSDTGFAQDVARLNADLAQAASTVQTGQDPSGLADTLQADGTTVGADCSAAGYSQ